MRELPHLEQHIYNCTNMDVYDKDIFTNILKKKLIKQMVILIMNVTFCLHMLDYAK